MNEREFYNDDFEFEGSRDDDGCIYDSRHRLIGHVEDGTIYDTCNIPRGHINADGQVTDMCNIPTGKEFGANFEGWGGHRSGMVRNDVLGTGHGNDYGIFSQVKDANRQYGMDDDDYSGDDEEDEDYGGDDGDSDDGGWDDFSSDPAPSFRRKTRRNGGGASNDGASIDEIGCIAGVIFFLVLGALIYYGLRLQG